MTAYLKENVVNSNVTLSGVGPFRFPASIVPQSNETVTSSTDPTTNNSLLTFKKPFKGFLELLNYYSGSAVQDFLPTISNGDITETITNWITGSGDNVTISSFIISA